MLLFFHQPFLATAAFKLSFSFFPQISSVVDQVDFPSRIKYRVQITTDGHKAYLEAVENAYGADIDYAQLQKIYGASMENETRYSPARCIGCDMKVVSGNPRKRPQPISSTCEAEKNLILKALGE